QVPQALREVRRAAPRERAYRRPPQCGRRRFGLPRRRSAVPAAAGTLRAMAPAQASSPGSLALCDNCCIAASRGFHPSRAGQGGPRGVHQVSETSTIEQVTLNAGDKAVTLPVARGTLGAPCIEIAKLPKETGCFTYDPGFTAT